MLFFTWEELGGKSVLNDLQLHIPEVFLDKGNGFPAPAKGSKRSSQFALVTDWVDHGKQPVNRQQGISVKAFDERRSHGFWEGLLEFVPIWDEMIAKFNG